MEFNSLQSINFPDRFIRHQNFLGELTQIHTDLDKQDATFQIIHLGNTVRLSAAFQGNLVLRHQDFRIKLFQFIQIAPPGGLGNPDTPENQLAQNDETFFMVPGLADSSAVSFRSLNFQDRFIRHRDFHLFLEPAQADDLARHDATFRLVEPFAVPPPIILH
jgi:hypothetical protein